MRCRTKHARGPCVAPSHCKSAPGTQMRLQLPAAVTALVASATDKMWEANVRATGKDQLRLNEDVEIRPSFGKGMGVFALRCACTNP